MLTKRHLAEHGLTPAEYKAKRGLKKWASLACKCAWTVEGLFQMGAEHFRSLVFDQIPEAGAVLGRADYLARLHELCAWLKADA